MTFNFIRKITPKQLSALLVCITLLMLALVLVLLWYFQLSGYVPLTYLHNNMHTLQVLVRENYWVAVICYFALYIVATMCAIPGCSVFTTAGGLLFGIWPGILYALMCATIGATLLFLICRYLIGSWVQQRYTEQLAGFNNEISLHGHHYLLVVRLIAILPFGLVTMLSGLTLLSIRTFIWVTFVGLIPVSFVYTYVGSQLVHLESINDFSSVTAFSVFVLFKVALVPALVKIGKRFSNSFSTRRAYSTPLIIIDRPESPKEVGRSW